MESRRYKIHNFRRKNNRDKIKSSYHETKHWYHPGNWATNRDPCEYFTIQVVGYGRHPKTTNERRQNAAHCEEYGEWVVRGKRRGYNLPTSWEDRPLGVWKLKASWKHKSKRSKQYKF